MQFSERLNAMLGSAEQFGNLILLCDHWNLERCCYSEKCGAVYHGLRASALHHRYGDEPVNAAYGTRDCLL
jgi:hypothetical protein